MAGFLVFVAANARWLAAGFALAFASGFGQTFFISVFAGNIRADYGLSHAEWGGIYAGATMAAALVMIWAGGLSDRLRTRHLGVGALLALALVALVMGLAEGVVMLWLAVFGLRLFGQSLLSHIALVSMARWFVATRGRAVAISGLGMALAEAGLPLAFVILMGLVDWRWLWALVALILLGVATLVWPLLRHERTPQALAVEGGSAGMGGRMWGRIEALRHPAFWLILPAFLGPPLWNTAFYFHQVHLAQAKGWAHLELVAMYPVLTFAAVCSLFAAGWLVDRIGSTRLAGVFSLPLALGYGAFYLSDTQAGALGAMALMGMGVGLHGMMVSTFWAEIYGTKHLGRLRAMTGAVMVLGTALGPGITGLWIDGGTGFPDQTGIIAIYFFGAAALGGLAGKVARQGLGQRAGA